MASTDDFKARSSDELSLGKGDRIQLIERDDDFGDGWFLGKHLSNGKTGLFPEGEHKRDIIVPNIAAEYGQNHFNIFISA